MDFGQLLTYALGLLGAVGGLIALLTYRRQFPKRRIQFSVSWSPLLNKDGDEAHVGDLEVTVRGTPLFDPYVGVLRVYSNSRADIPSSSFDAGSPLTFDFRTPLFSTSTPDPADLKWSANGTRIEIPAQLIRKKSGLIATLIVEGKPSAVHVESPLVDIDVQKVDWEYRATAVSKALFIATVVMAVVTTMLFFIAAVTGQL